MTLQSIKSEHRGELNARATRGSRVLMLVANAGSTDARVRKQAESLSAIGHDVTVLGAKRADLTKQEVLNGVVYLRTKLPGTRILRFYRHMAINYLLHDRSFQLLAITLGMLGACGAILVSTALYFIFIAARWAWPAATFLVSSIPLTAWLVGAGVCASAFLTALPMWRSLMRFVRRIVLRIAFAPYAFTLILIRAALPSWLQNLSAPRAYGSVSSALWSHVSSDQTPWDVIHAHDLNTLMAGVRIAKRDSAELIFDAHEIATHEDDQHEHGERLFKRAILRSLMPHVSKVVTVSVGFARHFEAEYGKHAHVIYNTPLFSSQSRLGQDVRNDLGLPHSVPLCVYIGGINKRRASIELATAITLLPENYHVAFVSNARPEVRDEMMAIISSSPTRVNVHWLPTVPHDEVVHYIKTADLSLVTRKPPTDHVNIQREFSMPNKLFESAMAGVPILAGNSSEIRDFLRETGLGLTTDCSKPSAIASRIVEVYENRQNYRKTGLELEQIRKRYGWVNALQVLAEVYGTVETSLENKPLESAA